MKTKNPLELLGAGAMAIRLKLAKPLIAVYRAETGDYTSDDLHAYYKAFVNAYRKKYNDYHTKDYQIFAESFRLFRIVP